MFAIIHPWKLEKLYPMIFMSIGKLELKHSGVPTYKYLAAVLAGIFSVFLIVTLATPMNGFDTPPREVQAGDTVYQYVAEAFNENPELTRSALQRLPAPYTFIEDCENLVAPACVSELSVVPPSNILLANSYAGAGDGDTIAIKDDSIIVTKPSGRVDTLTFVTHDQLVTRRYSQIAQNIILFGLLLIVLLLIIIILSPKKPMNKTQNKDKPTRVQIILGSSVIKKIAASWTVFVFVASILGLTFVSLRSASTSFASIIFLSIFIQIALVVVPGVMLFVVAQPLYRYHKPLQAWYVVVLSLLAGLLYLTCYAIAIEFTNWGAFIVANLNYTYWLFSSGWSSSSVFILGTLGYFASLSIRHHRAWSLITAICFLLVLVFFSVAAIATKQLRYTA